MDRRTKISVGLLLVALLAVAGGLWRRLETPKVAVAPAQPQYHVLTSGLVEAAAEHRAVLNEALLVPKEVEAAEAQSRGADRPPIVNPGPPPTQPNEGGAPQPGDLAEVPPSQQVLIGFTGGVIGETDPCG